MPALQEALRTGLEPGPVAVLHTDEQGQTRLEVKAYCEHEQQETMREVVQRLLDALMKEVGQAQSGASATTAG